MVQRLTYVDRSGKKVQNDMKHYCDHGRSKANYIQFGPALEFSTRSFSSTHKNELRVLKRTNGHGPEPPKADVYPDWDYA